ncbi:MAG: hypothetical protein JRC66_08050, partial [Deltaproteobacteria bacterium]|nr:hypothetical protein [Deltaproteobacteria bacterium]
MRLNETLQQLGRPVAYYPQIAHFLGDVKTAIFFCQFAYWTGKEKDEDVGIYKTRESLYQETGLSRLEQETARRNLKRKGYLTESYMGLPRKLYFLFDWDKISEDWEEFNQNNQENQHNAGNPPTRGRETYRQAGGKPTSKQVGKLPAITENTTKNTTENTNKEEEAFSPSHTKSSSRNILDS